MQERNTMMPPLMKDWPKWISFR